VIRATFLLGVALALVACSDDDRCDEESFAATSECRHPKVLLIGVEGLRPDAVDALALSSKQAGLRELVRSGAYSSGATAPTIADRGPGWAALLFGVRRDRHGVTDDSIEAARGEDLFERVERANPELVTAMFGSWPALVSASGAADLASHRDAPAAAASAQLGGAGGDLIVVQLDQLRAVGDRFGFGALVPEYMAALEDLDAEIAGLVAAVARRPKTERWLTIVAGVYAGRPDGRFGTDDPEDVTVPMIFRGATVVRGPPEPPPRAIDVPATILAHLAHLGPDASVGLLGTPVALSPTPRRVPVLGANTLASAQANQEPPVVDTGVGVSAGRWTVRGELAVLTKDTAGLVVGSDDAVFASAGPTITSLTQSLALSTVSFGSNATIELAGAFGGLLSNDAARLTARFFDDTRYAAVAWTGDKGYLFRDSRYWRYDFNTRRIDAGYPQPISLGTWLGLGDFKEGAHDLDAVVLWEWPEAYFFKGDEFLVWNIRRDATVPNIPFIIGDELPDLARFAGGARDIDAATASRDGKVHFFKGDEYIRYDVATRRADDGYPRKISRTTWRGLHVWPTGVEAAMFDPAGEHVFFRGGSTVRYEIDQANARPPAVIDDSSFGAELDGWKLSQRAVQIGAANPGDRPKIETVQSSGTVPPSTTRIDVDLLLVASSSVGRAYADDLSLVIER